MQGETKTGSVSYDTAAQTPEGESVSYDTNAPAPRQIAAYQRTFEVFNRELFDGQLPHVVLNFSRLNKALGFFAPERWTPRDENSPERARDENIVHEISLNPTYLRARTTRDTASTLVHEMVHLWQEAFGKKKPRMGYHNREWADKMEEVGLMPSNTGLPGGKRTGQSMTHYIIEDGAFARVFADLPPECLLPWLCEDHAARRRAAKRKTKYTCPECQTNVWGKADLIIECRSCECAFEEISS